MNKVLVAFYSRPDENYNVGTVAVGNTELLAQHIAAQLGADLFKIDPVSPYPTDYSSCVDQATTEKNSDARPAFRGSLADFASYDTIFLGYPIWWNDFPMIIHTFLEQYDFSGKTIVPFCTHEGSGQSGTFGALKEKLPAATIQDGLAITGSIARTDEGKAQVDAWLASIDF